MFIRVELRIFTYNLRICCGKYEDVTSISEAMYASVTVVTRIGYTVAGGFRANKVTPKNYNHVHVTRTPLVLPNNIIHVQSKSFDVRMLG